MIATGGFGAFPDNPLTQLLQEVISENVSADFLEPFNVYVEDLLVPTFAMKPKADDNLGVVGVNQNNTATTIPVSDTVSTPTPSETLTTVPTETPTASATLTSTLTETYTPTVTPMPSNTPTYLPTWTRTRKPPKVAPSPDMTQTIQAGG